MIKYTPNKPYYAKLMADAIEERKEAAHLLKTAGTGCIALSIGIIAIQILVLLAVLVACAAGISVSTRVAEPSLFTIQIIFAFLSPTSLAALLLFQGLVWRGTEHNSSIQTYRNLSLVWVILSVATFVFWVHIARFLMSISTP